MNTVALAIRNLWRNRRRSLATLLGIGFGSIAILLFGGYKANIKQTMQTDFVRRGGHLQIQHKDFFLYGSGNPTAYGLSNYDQIISAIKDDPHLRKSILVVTPTLQFGGIAGNYEAAVSRTVIGNGVVAAEQAAMRDWDPYDIHLNWLPYLLKDSSPTAAVIGLGVARVLQLCEVLGVEGCVRPDKPTNIAGASLPNDIAELTVLEKGGTKGQTKPLASGPSGRKIELLASNPRGTPNVAALEVIRAESQGFKEWDEVYVVMHLAQAQRLVFGAAKPKVTAIHVQLRDTRQLQDAQEYIAVNLPSWASGQRLVVRDVGELNPFYVQSIRMFDTIFGFMFVLIGTIVMFTVSNTMNTAVIERTVEIGTLRAIGLRRSGIRQLFVTEGVILGIVGAALGVIAALAIAAVINRLGLQWLPPGSAGLLPLAVSLWGELGLIIGTSLALVAVATLSAWWPAYRAAQLNVVDALRHA